MSERDCENCKHHTEKGCDSWDCNFEQGMTREDAIKRLKLWLICSEEYTEDDVSMNEAIRIAINSLEIDERYELEYEQIEPCEDAISREPFTNSTICEGFSCEECSFNRKDKGGCILEERVMKLPSVNPQEPKTNILDKIKDEIDRQEKWLLKAGYTAYNVDIAFDAIRSALTESEEKNENGYPL